jgi:hypothetical protein
LKGNAELGHTEDQGVNRRMILKWISMILITQESDWWRALVNTVMKLKTA